MKRFSALLATAIIAAGLVGFGSTTAHAAAVVQDGPVNYAGPGPCPAAATDCLIAAGDIDVVQTAPTAGSNTVDCRGASCKADQSGSTSASKPQNTATCANSSTAGNTDQRCDVSQTGGANKITANLSAAQAVSRLVGSAQVVQQNEQRLVTNQTGDTNELNVNGTINQQATSVLDIPVTHAQRTLLSSSNTMTATASNVANLTLNRTQTSTATGSTVTQLQDNIAGDETDGAVVGLGYVRLIAKTPGTNAIKVRANDTKRQTATSLGLATQQQGHDVGGWTVDTSGTDTGTPNPDGSVDLDLGTPGSSEGVKKDWSQTAAGLLGANITKDQDQIDNIKLPSIGLSPQRAIFNGINKLSTDAGGHEVCRAESEGHAQIGASGMLTCDLRAGSKVQNQKVDWDAQTWDVNMFCELNNDQCPGGTVNTEIKGVDIRIFGAYKKNGTIPVAVLSYPDDGNPATVDDATTINPATACFGMTPPDPSQSDCTSHSSSLTDVDDDGDTDLMLHFDANDSRLKPSADIACLTAETYGGEAVEGCGALPKS